MSYNYSNNNGGSYDAGGGGMVKAIVALQLLSSLYQVVAAIEVVEFDSSGDSGQFIWIGAAGVVGALSAIWLYRGSNASRVVALIWHLIVAGWMLMNMKTDVIIDNPVPLGVLGISVVSILYLTVTSLTGIMRAAREQ